MRVTQNSYNFHSALKNFEFHRTKYHVPLTSISYIRHFSRPNIISSFTELALSACYIIGTMSTLNSTIIENILSSEIDNNWNGIKSRAQQYQDLAVKAIYVSMTKLSVDDDIYDGGTFDTKSDSAIDDGIHGIKENSSKNSCIYDIKNTRSTAIKDAQKLICLYKDILLENDLIGANYCLDLPESIAMYLFHESYEGSNSSKDDIIKSLLRECNSVLCADELRNRYQ